MNQISPSNYYAYLKKSWFTNSDIVIRLSSSANPPSIKSFKLSNNNFGVCSLNN